MKVILIRSNTLREMFTEEGHKSLKASLPSAATTYSSFNLLATSGCLDGSV